MADENTTHIRIYRDGLMNKLKDKVGEQFIEKHGLKLHDRDILEVIAKAVIDKRLFEKINK